MKKKKIEEPKKIVEPKKIPLSALRWTNTVTPDLPMPTAGSRERACGWSFNLYRVLHSYTSLDPTSINELKKLAPEFLSVLPDPYHASPALRNLSGEDRCRSRGRPVPVVEVAMTISAILIIPESGDPQGILEDGPCGARPPKVRRYTCPKGHGYSWATTRYTNAHCHGVIAEPVPMYRDRCFAYATTLDALPLAWEGKPVEEGCVWLNVRCKALALENIFAVVLYMFQTGVPYEPLEVAGKIVFLDDKGKEIP